MANSSSAKGTSYEFLVSSQATDRSIEEAVNKRMAAIEAKAFVEKVKKARDSYEARLKKKIKKYHYNKQNSLPTAEIEKKVREAKTGLEKAKALLIQAERKA